MTALPFAGLWFASWFCAREGWWALSLLLCVPAGAFLVRLFMIQHDCGHGSFFPSRIWNDGLGRVLGVLTLTPYAYWRRTHAVHHATTGNLDRRGIGDVDTLTMEEYEALPEWRRLFYRVCRNPWALVTLGPIYLFILRQRLPLGLMGEREAWVSTLGTNLAIASLIAVGGSALGFAELFWVQLPVTVVAGGIGIWLFFVQHQFDGAYWRRGDDWNYHVSALHGSTYYDLPPVLRWFSANIGVHHVHHLASRIPSYRLAEPVRDHPELSRIGRITLRESLRCFRLGLWDEHARRLRPFGELEGRTR